MLLETLDVKRNDVLIYSENIFDLNNNFKIIFKKDKIKRAFKINYFDVCDFVSEPTPKNIIVYRLLTNVSNLDSYSTKYGYFIKSQTGMDLIYFDPIFAIKDLKNLKIDIDIKDFRFKIQQVGFTTLKSGAAGNDYSEIFSWDMRAVEAQNQNDRIFADALFMFDENYVADDNEFGIGERERLNRIDLVGSNSQALREDSSKLQRTVELEKPDVKIDNQISDSKELKKMLLKQALGITSVEGSKRASNFSSFLEKYRNDVVTKVDSEAKSELADLFKDKSGKEKSKNLRDDSVVLRFTDER